MRNFFQAPFNAWPVVALGAAITLASLAGARVRRSHGSPTNANEAMDDVHLPPRPSTEQVLDAAVQQTFPASDPPAMEKAFETAYEREKRMPGTPRDDMQKAPPAPARSPDWMLGR